MQRRGRFGLPLGQYALGVKRREFPLYLIGEGEIQGERLTEAAVADDGLGFARIVIRIVAKEDDSTADFLLQPQSGPNLRHEVAAREEPARLLAKANHGLAAHVGVTPRPGSRF